MLDLAIVACIRAQPGFDREGQLARLVAALRAFLPAGAAAIYVVEQGDDGRRFNRGQLMNVGAWLVAADGGARALCFHDVDLLPTPALRAEYLADAADPAAPPCHLAAQYARYRGPRYFGGIVRLAWWQFAAANGFPNDFWGWGGEDDALRARLARLGIEPRAAEGGVEDIEVPEGGAAPLSLDAKMAALRDAGAKCPDKRERIARDGAAWRANGYAQFEAAPPRVTALARDGAPVPLVRARAELTDPACRAGRAFFGGGATKGGDVELKRGAGGGGGGAGGADRGVGLWVRGGGGGVRGAADPAVHHQGGPAAARGNVQGRAEHKEDLRADARG